MSETPLPERLEEFLQTPPSAPANAALRQAILQRTLPMRRRGWRRLAFAGAWAASLAAAFLAGWMLPRSGNVEPQPRPQIVEHKTPAPAPPEVKPQPPVDDASPKSAYELEWAAFDTMEDRERAKLYFRAGDLYLEKHNDIPSALRCYRQAIACCDADGLAFDPKDNWLLVALKHDNRKER
jgi:hypothetical protein